LRRAIQVWLMLCAAAAIALVGALSQGTLSIPAMDALQLLLRPEESTASEVIHHLRLPRALAAFAAGGLLAVAGALMQVLLRNPLADPFILGISGGSAVGALGAMLLGLSAALVDLGAFVGALVSILLVFAVASRDLVRVQMSGPVDASPRLLLTGVVLAAGWSALITLILTLAPQAQIRGMLFWLMGDVSGADSYTTALLALLAVLVIVYPVARELNVMLRGETLAQALGVPVARVRNIVYFAASLATAFAVTTTGTVGFVGLIVPHALRIVIGNDQRMLLPACAVAGGTLLLIADTVARMAIAPQQLPVGVITALVGVPTFMWLLLRGGRRA